MACLLAFLRFRSTIVAVLRSKVQEESRLEVIRQAAAMRRKCQESR